MIYIDASSFSSPFGMLFQLIAEEEQITEPPVTAPSVSASYSGGLTLALRNAIWHGENHKNAVNLILDLGAENGTGAGYLEMPSISALPPFWPC